MAVLTTPIVYVVDDDVHLREALRNLFKSVGIRVELFGSTAELLARPAKVSAESCLVLDIRLPGVSGLDFQNQLAKLGNNIPIIFMTGHGDVPMSVRAMKAGAIDFSYEAISGSGHAGCGLECIGTGSKPPGERRRTVRADGAV